MVLFPLGIAANVNSKCFAHFAPLTAERRGLGLFREILRPLNRSNKLTHCAVLSCPVFGMENNLVYRTVFLVEAMILLCFCLYYLWEFNIEGS